MWNILNTILCRGFAFVVFKTVQSLQDAVAEQEHSVKGKKVAVKKAKAKEGKIYVGKLKPELSDEETSFLSENWHVVWIPCHEGSSLLNGFTVLNGDHRADDHIVVFEF